MSLSKEYLNNTADLSNSAISVSNEELMDRMILFSGEPLRAILASNADSIAPPQSKRQKLLGRISRISAFISTP